MTVVKTYLYKLQIESIEMCSKETNELLNYFTLCSDGSISNVDGKEILIGDPTETALVKASLEKGFTKEKLSQEYPRFNELAFDSDRKMMTVFVKHEGKVISITKGGPDVILVVVKILI